MKSEILTLADNICENMQIAKAKKMIQWLMNKVSKIWKKNILTL